MLSAFKNHINSNFTFLRESKLLIAISGGLDSVVLTHLCHQLELNIVLAHCNFNLRGAESDGDEDFVLQLAEDLDVESFFQKFDTNAYANNHKISTQMAARELRYDWFNDLIAQFNFDCILTAHHADDNLETFLINLSRGTGLDGLTGIPEVNETIVRPLLPFSREQIEVYARANALKWREDSSNASTKYLRNAIRHNVIPALKEINPHFLQNFSNTQQFLQESKMIIDHSVNKLRNDAFVEDENVLKIDIQVILKFQHPKVYLYQLLKDYNFTEWNDVLDLLEAQSGKQIFSTTHRLIKDRDYLLLTNINETEYQNIAVLETDNKVETPLGMLHFDQINVSNPSKHIRNCIYVDRDKLSFPLNIRKWQEGDSFYPLGMSGKKKLSKYFKDEKFSLLEKENIWMLCSKNDVVWVINNRADNRFKISEYTERILKIELE